MDIQVSHGWYNTQPDASTEDNSVQTDRLPTKGGKAGPSNILYRRLVRW